MTNFIFFSPLSAGVWTQGFLLARQVLYHLSQDPDFFCFSYFSGRVKHFCPGLASVNFLLTVLSLAEITDAYNHLVCLNGVLLIIFPHADRWTEILSILAS
jgi:hypothetical protein